VVGYYKHQRCGVTVPGTHDVCHLDDARRRDNGEYVDTTGGWHDAGDLRKWMTATMTNGIALLVLAHTLGDEWDFGVSGVQTLLEEVRWGNRYFLKMQDKDGRVFADVAGGVNGDNSDNHWTDNQRGTADDRYLNPSKPGSVQPMFVYLQSLAAQAWRERDPPYAGVCLKAAARCWDANKPGSSTQDLSFWTLAAIEFARASKREGVYDMAATLATRLADLQAVSFTGSQHQVRGFWKTSAADATPYVNAVHSALPALHCSRPQTLCRNTRPRRAGAMPCGYTSRSMRGRCQRETLTRSCRTA
jgi:hypothetical protein